MLSEMGLSFSLEMSAPHWLRDVTRTIVQAQCLHAILLPTTRKEVKLMFQQIIHSLLGGRLCYEHMHNICLDGHFFFSPVFVLLGHTFLICCPACLTECDHVCSMQHVPHITEVAQSPLWCCVHRGSSLMQFHCERVQLLIWAYAHPCCVQEPCTSGPSEEAAAKMWF